MRASPDPASSETQRRVRDILGRQDTLEQIRKPWESLWAEAAALVAPRLNLFGEQQKEPTQAQRRDEGMFDSTGVLALERYVAALESLLCPRSTRWHGLRATEAIDKDDWVREYLEECVRRQFSARYTPRANFAGQISEVFFSLGAFGTGVVFTDEEMGPAARRGLRYRAIHLNEVFLAANHQGVIDTVHRRFSLTARQAAQRFGLAALPQQIRTVAERVNGDADRQTFEFLHCVAPNSDLDPRYADARGMAFTSTYVAIDGARILEEGGYQTQPYAVSRYVTSPREIYGRSPAITVLADLKMLQEMNRVAIRAAQKALDPPLIASDMGVLAPFSMRAGALNPGYLSDQGAPLVQPLAVNTRLDVGLEMIQDRRQAINAAFLVTLFQILVEAPQMTATEALIRAQEKGALLAPTLGRQQSELLGPMIERELDLMTRMGEFDDLEMPDLLAERGGVIEVEYDSPLNRLQRSDEGVGVLRMIEALAGPAQIDPSVYDVLDFERLARTLARVNAVPADVVRSPKEMQERRAAKAQQEQAAAALQAAPVVAKTIESLTNAQATAQNQPSYTPRVV